MEAQDKPVALGSTNPDRNRGDTILKINYMSILFVGIDISSKTNAVYAMDFEETSTFGNNQPGAEELADMIVDCMRKHKNLDHAYFP